MKDSYQLVRCSRPDINTYTEHGSHISCDRLITVLGIKVHLGKKLKRSRKHTNSLPNTINPYSIDTLYQTMFDFW